MKRRIRDNNDGTSKYINIETNPEEEKYGSGIDLQKVISTTTPYIGELHLRTFPKFIKYEFCGPNTDVKRRVRDNVQGINRLDNICRTHDIAYENAKNNLGMKHEADQNMINEINKLENQTLIEKAVKNIIKIKKHLGLGFAI